jgi:DNA (cytosine-5)-methyltransferase 1
VKNINRTAPLDFEAELIVDNFAGGGGASTGIEMGFEKLGLKREVAIAINHDGEALTMHLANHPKAKHYREDVFDIHPGFVTRQQPIGLAWFSPDCKHHSKAKGGKPRDQKIRGLAWVTLKWAALQFPRVIALENVREFADWGPLDAVGKPDRANKGRTFNAFVSALSTGISPDHPDLAEIHSTLGGDFPISRLFGGLGYKVEWRSLRACDFGAPTIRTRLYLIARRDGQPIVWPQPTHGDPKLGRPQSKLLPWKTAADCIDFSIPCPSIFERKRPLADATLRRIARGLKKFVIDSSEPFLVDVAHGEVNAAGTKQWGPGTRRIDIPLNTVVTSGNPALVVPRIAPFVSTYYGDKRPTDVRGVAVDAPIGTQTTENRHAVVAATLVQTGYGERQGQEPRAPGLDKPLGTVVAGGGKHALVAAFLAQHNKEVNGYKAGRAATVPLSTITSKGSQQQVVTAHITKFRSGSVGSDLNEPMHTLTAGGETSRPSTGNVMGVVTSSLVKLRGDNVGQPNDEPLATISAQGTHHAEVRAFLLKYYGNERDGSSCNEPTHTVRANDCFGLVYVHGQPYEIVDIGLRMLTPRELARCQGFPDSYQLTPLHNGKPLSKTAQVRMIGNSVCPDVAAALVAANFVHELAVGNCEAA